MAKQTINIGTNQDDGTGDLLRTAFQKVNENFTEVYNEIGGDSLSSLRFSGSTITSDGTNQNIIINPNGSGKLDVQGDTLLTGNVTVTGSQTVQQSLAVTGTSTLTGNTTIAGSLDVSGATTLSTLTLGTSSLSSSGTSELADVTVSGTATFNGAVVSNGNVDLGDTTTDTITVTGRFDSSLVPVANNTYDFGGSSLRWKTGYFNSIDVSTLSVTATSFDQITIGGNKISSNTSNANITLAPNGTGQIDIRSNVNLNGNTITGNITSTGTSTFSAIDVNGGAIDGTPIGAASTSTGAFSSISMVDSANINLGTGNDLRLYHNGTNSYIDNHVGPLYIRNNVTSDLGNNIIIEAIAGKASAVFQDDEGVRLYYNNAQKFETTAAGVSITGDLTVSSGQFSGALMTDGLHIIDNNIQGINTNENIVLLPSGSGSVEVRSDLTFVEDHMILPDNSEVRFGTGTDLIIRHNATNSEIENSTGDLQIKSNNNIVLGDRNGDETFAKFIDNGAVELYHNNVKIIETAATGANITGNLTLSDIAFTDNNITTTRSNDELILNPNGTGNIVADGHVRLTVQSGNPTADTSSGYVFAKTDTNTEVHVMDGAGNVTKISPHNEAGDWEYYSVNTKTGKTVRVNMERMIRKLEELTGETFIEDF